MTAKDFVAWATGYYGPYPVGQRQDIAEYLSGLGPDDLDELRVQMRASCPSHIGQVNGYPPDIEAMEKLMPEVRRIAAATARSRRELAYASRMLPAPGDTSDEAGVIDLDWGEVFRLGKVRAKELAEERERQKASAS